MSPIAENRHRIQTPTALGCVGTQTERILSACRSVPPGRTPGEPAGQESKGSIALGAVSSYSDSASLEVADRRFRGLYIEPCQIIKIMDVSRERDGGKITFPAFPLLPEGYILVASFFDFARQAFGFWIAHPSFDRVPFGTVPMEIQDYSRIAMVDRIVTHMTPAASWREQPSLV